MGCITSCFLCLNIKDDEEYILENTEEKNEIFLNKKYLNKKYLNYYLSNRFNSLD